MGFFLKLFYVVEEVVEANENRTHPWAFDPYNGVEDREAHQLPVYLRMVFLTLRVKKPWEDLT